MSLINKMNAVKNKLGGIDKVTYAKLYTETGIDNVIIIELNGILFNFCEYNSAAR